MKWASLGCIFVCIACGDNLEGPSPTPPDTPEDPLLSNEPLVRIGGEPCLGRRVTVADVDGNGFDDVIAYRPDCMFFTPSGESTPTELWIVPGIETGLGEPVIGTIGLQGIEAFLRRVNAGDINGDGYDDVLLDGPLETTLYMGAPSIEDMLATGQNISVAPFGLFLDVDGDGADEYLIQEGSDIAIQSWNEDMQAFVTRSALPGSSVSVGGDLDGDGLTDLFVRTDTGIVLYYGCRSGESCSDGLRTPPVATALDELPQAMGDIDGDGLGDVMVRTQADALGLHLTGPDHVPAAAPAWRVLPDPLYGTLGSAGNLGDVNGDGQGGDVAVTTLGRIMLFRSDSGLPEPAPSWEWHLGHATDPDYEGGLFTPLMMRDINGDGYQDVVALLIDGYIDGSIIVYTGGRVPPDAIAPEVPTEYACFHHEGTLPDLTVDPDLIERSLRIRNAEFAADSCEVAEQCVVAPGQRKLLDFSVAVQNFGGAAAILPNSKIAPELYEYDTCHQHDHLVDFANYELLDSNGDVVVAGHKQGYFLIDVVAYCDLAPEASPGGFGDYLFISPGWADVYYAGLECQWIDITDVPDGAYRLRVEVNTSGVFEEDDQVNNAVEVAVDISGDRVTVGN